MTIFLQFLLIVAPPNAWVLQINLSDICKIWNFYGKWML
jgi:hypothetical protein